MHKFVHHRVVQIWQAGCPFPVKVRHAEFHKLFSLFGQWTLGEELADSAPGPEEELLRRVSFLELK